MAKLTKMRRTPKLNLYAIIIEQLNFISFRKFKQFLFLRSNKQNKSKREKKYAKKIYSKCRSLKLYFCHRLTPMCENCLSSPNDIMSCLKTFVSSINHFFTF